MELDHQSLPTRLWGPGLFICEASTGEGMNVRVEANERVCVRVCAFVGAHLSLPYDSCKENVIMNGSSQRIMSGELNPG